MPLAYGKKTVNPAKARRIRQEYRKMNMRLFFRSKMESNAPVERMMKGTLAK